MTADGPNRQLRYAFIAELAGRLEAVSPQFGKTVLMKLLYLLQEVYNIPLGYRFSFYTYGPYASEVLVDLERVRILGGAEVEFVGNDPGGYLIAPGSRVDQVRSGSQPDLDNYSKQLDQLTELFGHFRAKDLELRTTIVYVWKNLLHRTVGNGEELMNIVSQLKPHFSEGDIENAMLGLQDANVIETIRD